ncbi:MAG: hypothetical protein GX564_03530, partial [Oligosphaeraceae bacterium]|nr:hypothetical protein [Oligosphaeraceae bacterium]
NQTVTVSVTIPNQDGTWRPGLFVRGEAALAGQSSALLVPAEAILELDAKPVVFVHLGGEAFAARAIRTGRQSNGVVEILSGLTEGEKIVSAGAFTLKAVKEVSGMDSHAGHGH